MATTLRSLRAVDDAVRDNDDLLAEFEDAPEDAWEGLVAARRQDLTIQVWLCSFIEVGCAALMGRSA